MSEQTPMERITEIVYRRHEDSDIVEVFAGDLGILWAAAVEAEETLKSQGRDTDSVCVLIGNLHGQDGHDWSEWRNEYIASGGDLWHERVCRRCGEIDYERVP